MINKDPLQRPSANQILEHSWFKIRESNLSKTPFLAASDAAEQSRMTMGDIFNKNLQSTVTDFSDERGSISGSFLNKTRLTLKSRLSMKKANSINPALTMKVQDLMTDLLRNGLDLSFLDDSRSAGQFNKFLKLRLSHSNSLYEKRSVRKAKENINKYHTPSKKH